MILDFFRSHFSEILLVFLMFSQFLRANVAQLTGFQLPKKAWPIFFFICFISIGAFEVLAVLKGFEREALYPFQKVNAMMLPKLGLILGSLLLLMGIESSKSVLENEKPNAIFLALFVITGCFSLLQSSDLLMSVLLLFLIGVAESVLQGLTSRDGASAEVLIKFTKQFSVSVALSFFCIFLLIVIAGGSDFQTIANYLRQANGSHQLTLGVVIVAIMPFLLLGSIFPFHMQRADTGGSQTWGLLVLNSVIVQATVVTALVCCLVQLHGHLLGQAPVPQGMRLVQVLGVLGTAWWVVYSFTQPNIKKLVNAIFSGSIMILLVCGVSLRSENLAAFIYSVSAFLIWGSILGFTFTHLVEESERESAVVWSVSSSPLQVFSFFMALAAATIFPGLPGLWGGYLLLKSMVGLGELGLLAIVGILAICVYSMPFRIYVDFWYSPRRTAIGTSSESKGVGLRSELTVEAFTLLLCLAALVFQAFAWRQIVSRAVDWAQFLLKVT